MKHDVVRVFILPPTAALEQRLRARAQDPRTSCAAHGGRRHEIATGREYDYVLVNTDLEATSTTSPASSPPSA